MKKLIFLLIIAVTFFTGCTTAVSTVDPYKNEIPKIQVYGSKGGTDCYILDYNMNISKDGKKINITKRTDDVGKVMLNARIRPQISSNDKIRLDFPNQVPQEVKVTVYGNSMKPIFLNKENGFKFNVPILKGVNYFLAEAKFDTGTVTYGFIYVVN